MKIRLTEIARVSNDIFERLKDEGYDEIEISHDFYWDIPKDELYQPYNEPAPENFTLGLISDDLIELGRIANHSRDLIPYHLVWLAAVLRAIGHEAYSAGTATRVTSERDISALDETAPPLVQ